VRRGRNDDDISAMTSRQATVLRWIAITINAFNRLADASHYKIALWRFVHASVCDHAVTVLEALTYAGTRESLAPVERRSGSQSIPLVVAPDVDAVGQDGRLHDTRGGLARSPQGRKWPS